MVVKSNTKGTKFNLSVWGILFVLAFLSSFVASTGFSDHFITPKHYFFIFLFIPVVVLISLKEFFRKYKFTFDVYLVDILFFAYFIYATLNSYLSRGELLENIRYVNFLICFIFYVVARYLLCKENPYAKGSRLIYTVYALLMLVGTLQAWYGILQYVGAIKNLQLEFRIGGAFGNPGPYANFLSAFLPVGLSYILFFNSEKRLRTIAWICVLSIIIAIPLTMARASWIASLIGGLYIFLHHKKAGKLKARYLDKAWQKILLASITLAFIFTSIFVLTSFKEDSASGRLFIWKVTCSMIADSPVWGHGFDTYAAVHNDYQADYFRSNPDDTENAFLADGINYAFNEYLQIGAEVGLLGLLLFLSLFFTGYYLKWKQRGDTAGYKPEKIAAEGMIAVILVTSLFSYPLHSINTYALLVFGLAVVATFSKRSKVFTLSNTPNFRKFLSIGFFALFSLVLLKVYPRYRAEKEWVKAFQLVRQGNYEEAKKRYDNLYPVMKYSQFFLFNYGAELSVMGDYKKSLELLEEVGDKLNDSDYWIYKGNSHEAVGDFALAAECFLQASYIMPVKFYPKYRLVLMYDKLADVESALRYAHEIADMEVKIESEIVANIRKEMEEYIKNKTEGF